MQNEVRCRIWAHLGAVPRVARVEARDVRHGRGLVAAVVRGLEGEDARARQVLDRVVHANRM